MIQIVRLLTYINDDITIHELNEVGISSSRELHTKILSLVFLKKKKKKKKPNGNEIVKLTWLGKKNWRLLPIKNGCTLRVGFGLIRFVSVSSSDP